MPYIKDINTVKAVARAYIANNMNKSKALISVGYKPSFANSGRRDSVYKNTQVQAEIQALLEVKTVQAELTIEIVLADLEYGIQQAKLRKPPDLGAIARFSELRGRYLAMYTDKQVVSTEQAQALTEQEQEQARAFAEWSIKQSLAGPKLAQAE